MPMFDYMCPKCGTVFEEFVPHHDTEVTCECGEKAQKLMCSAGINMQWWKGKLKGEVEFAQNPHAKNAYMKAETSYQDFKRNPRL